MLTAVDDLFRRSIMTLLTIYLVVGIVLIVGLVFIIRALVRTYLEYRGERLVLCPETEQYATVEIDGRLAAVTALFGASELRVENCSRWPEHEHCAQDCIWQIDLSPLGCPIRDLLISWYRGKVCGLCGRPFGKLSEFDRPALLSPEGNIVECEAVRPEAIPGVLSTHTPVCWDCRRAKKLRSEHWIWSRKSLGADKRSDDAWDGGDDSMAAHSVVGMVALLGVSLCSPGDIGREPRDIPHVDRAEPDVVQTWRYCDGVW